MFPPSFYDKLDPQYREKLVELLEAIESADTNLENLIFKFSNQFLTPKEIWIKLKVIMISSPTLMKLNVFKTSIFHLFYDFESEDVRSMYSESMWWKLYDFDTNTSSINVTNFGYPQKYLDKKLTKYERDAHSFLSQTFRQNFKRMKMLYSKIKSVEENVEEWFEALIEVEDEEFIEDNVENRIGNDLTNKKLWKMFFQYLKWINNKQKLLQTYSKYCRFFIGDTEMLEEYRYVAGNQKVPVPWKNPFDFELYDENFFVEPKAPAPFCAKNEPLSPIPHFNDENVSTQTFPFRPNLMHYILKSANAFVLHNLFKTCKWFYHYYPVRICYKFDTQFHVDNKIEICEQSFNVNPHTLNRTKIDKIFISTCLNVSDLYKQNDFSRFIPRIYRCTAKYISIENQKLSDKEMEFLIGHGNVEDLNLKRVRNCKTDYFILDDILKMIPKIKFLTIFGIQCSPKTRQMLYELEFQNEIEILDLIDIRNALLEPKAFAEFINKHLSSEFERCYVHFSYFNGRKDFVKSFEEIFEKCLDEKWKVENGLVDGIQILA
uniref:DUF38 domain-containing protein n=1 Tax=Panagrolaimus sp. PS1159 TaxID=55785 RepID=A0AC35GY66_9BILA